jgi:hypothetical protein
MKKKLFKLTALMEGRERGREREGSLENERASPLSALESRRWKQARA